MIINIFNVIELSLAERVRSIEKKNYAYFFIGIKLSHRHKRFSLKNVRDPILPYVRFALKIWKLIFLMLFNIYEDLNLIAP